MDQSFYEEKVDRLEYENQQLQTRLTEYRDVVDHLIDVFSDPCLCEACKFERERAIEKARGVTYATLY